MGAARFTSVQVINPHGRFLPPKGAPLRRRATCFAAPFRCTVRSPSRTVDGTVADKPDTGWDWRGLESRPPAFRPDDLRRAGALFSDPVIRAIRQGALPFVERVEWSAGRSAMERVFALQRLLRLFRAKPSAPWATFTEPQLTRGFAHFLKADEPYTRVARIRALLTSLGAAELGSDMTDVAVTAEARTAGNKRIDLLIEWTDSADRCCAAAIEAKFGHAVTPGQLPAYRSHLRNVARERRLLAVVAPRLSDRIARALRRNREWRWAAWRDLLLAHERVLPVACDDEDYLRFRRALWDHTG